MKSGLWNIEEKGKEKDRGDVVFLESKMRTSSLAFDHQYIVYETVVVTVKLLLCYQSVSLVCFLNDHHIRI